MPATGTSDVLRRESRDRCAGVALSGMLLVSAAACKREAPLLESPYTASIDAGRYRQLRARIDDNRHLSAHLSFAIDANTIRVVRSEVSDRDIPVLLAMLFDADFSTASAAASLLATRGAAAVPKLRELSAASQPNVAAEAKHALEAIEACADPQSSYNRDLCPMLAPR